MAKYSPKASAKVARAMHEAKEGTLKSGRSEKPVKSRAQAIAIGLSEAREEGAKVPSKNTIAPATKKTAAKKTVAKKTAAKKAVVKKAVAKKAVAQKRVAKKKASSQSPARKIAGGKSPKKSSNKNVA